MKRRSVLPRLILDRASREPLHSQLARALGGAIAAGDLPAGAPLPSTRALAASLGVSRNTVVTAYEELAAQASVAARPGSATIVAGPARAHCGPDWRAVVRSSQYRVDPAGFHDPAGRALYFHR